MKVKVKSCPPFVEEAALFQVSHSESVEVRPYRHPNIKQKQVREWAQYKGQQKLFIAARGETLLPVALLGNWKSTQCARNSQDFEGCKTQTSTKTISKCSARNVFHDRKLRIAMPWGLYSTAPKPKQSPRTRTSAPEATSLDNPDSMLSSYPSSSSRDSK